jgi:hypothetical protein
MTTLLVERNHDVAVIGGGPGGLPAAIAAAREGARTVLVERSSALGGAAASGLGILGYLDRSGNVALGGIAQELIDRLQAVGGSLGHFRCPVHNSITPVSPDLVKIVAVQMCREAGVDVLFNNELLDVDVANGRLTAATVYGKLTRTRIHARVFVDATGDGDLAALAGVPFVSGQDGTGVMQPSTLMFTITGHDLERFFAFLEARPEEVGIKEEYADGYDVDFFRRTPGHCFIGLHGLIAKAREAGDFDVPRNQFIYITSPNEALLAVNTSRVLRIDASDPFQLSAGLMDGYEQVLQITQFLNRYVPGFEKAAIAQISPALGVRETRHFQGLVRLSRGTMNDPGTRAQAVALSAYNMDIHSGESDTIDLTVVDEPFGIPFGCLVPATGPDNLLLSGRTISVDTAVYASARVMGPCIAIGEAAGTAAALAARDDLAVAAVPVQTLRDTLVRKGAVL